MLPSKFKGALVGDQHLSDVSPESRTDDYSEAIFEKIHFILSYCEEKEIKNVFFLGDMFHRKNPNLNSHYLVQRTIQLFNAFKDSLNIFTLVGNHDFTTNIAGLDRQPIYTVIQSGAARAVGLPPKPIVFECEGFKVEVNGLPYSDSEDGPEKTPSAYNLEYKHKNSFKIALFHSTLLPDGKSFFGSWVNFGDVAHYLDADFIGCGHYHPGYDPPVQKAHGKTWCNPGAISRGTAEDHNLTRKLKFCAFSYDGKKLVTRMVDIPHKEGKEVFNVDSLKRKKAAQKKHSDFVESLQDPNNMTMDVSSVEQLCRLASKISDKDRVVATVSRLLRDSSEELEGSL